MITTKEPISRFIVLTHNYKNVLNKSSIEHQVEDLIDIISFRIHNKPIDEVADTVLEKIFELRFEFIEWFFTNHHHKSLFNELQLAINKDIALKIQLSPYSHLAKTIALTLDTYGKIFAPIYDNPESIEKFLKNTDDSKPTYETFKLLSLHPSPQMQFFKKWMDASLKLEFGFILADLALTEQINLSDMKVNQLIDFLNTTLVHFGAYSIFTEFWQPNEQDTSNLINKMEILAAAIEMDNKTHYKMTQENLYHLIHS